MGLLVVVPVWEGVCDEDGVEDPLRLGFPLDVAVELLVLVAEEVGVVDIDDVDVDDPDSDGVEELVSVAVGERLPVAVLVTVPDDVTL